jgi:hypothetical protein
MPRRLLLLILSCTVLLAACHHGVVKRVSEPAASLQQLSVASDGRWKVQLRLQNYSTVAMVYDAVDLQVAVAGQEAGHLRASPGFSIGPSFADVASIDLAPTPAARMAVADALASGAILSYTLKGTITATPNEGKPRSFEIDTRSTLSPAPGLTGVLR